MSKSMKEFFSSESADGAEEVAVGSAEVASDVNEAIETTDEIEEEIPDTEEQDGHIEEAEEVTAQLEEVEGVLEASIAENEGEGVTEVAAEAIGIVLKNAHRRLGIDVSSASAVLAKENFSSTLSSRRENVKLVLETVSSTIKEAINKIIAGLKRIWADIKNFWNEHVATLGRLKKTLDSMRVRVRDLTGTQDTSNTLPPSASLQKAFYSSSNSVIDKDVVLKLSTAHKKATSDVASLTVELTSKVADAKDKAGVEAFAAASAGAIEGYKNEFLGSEASPLVGGYFAKVETKGEGDGVRFSLKSETRSSTYSKDRKFKAATQSEMVDVTKSISELIDATIKLRDTFTANDKTFNASLTKFTATLNDSASEGEGNDVAKGLKGILLAYGRFVPLATSNITKLNTNLARAGILFVNRSAGSFKKA